MPSGYTASLPDDTLVDVAVLSYDVSGTQTPFGVSRGGLTFASRKEYRNVEFDGKRAPIAGLDRITSHSATISGTFIQIGSAQLKIVEPASTSATATGVETITPSDASTLIAVGDLVKDLTLTYQTLSGGTVKVVFPYALCTEYEIAGQDNSEGEMKCTFEARLAVSGSNTDAAPYVITVA